MNGYVALLRAINLGSHNKVAMADLRTLVESLGFDDVQTLVQSGNVVFHGSGEPAAIETTLREATARQLRVDTDFFVRADREWAKIVAANPFAREAKKDPTHVVLMTLKEAPARGAEAALTAAIKGRERARVIGREAYLTYPDGQGRSKLTIKVIEKALGTSGTARNWNTVLRIHSLLSR